MDEEDEERGSGQPEKAAAICYRCKQASIELLLVKANGGGWIFPKGSIEPAELSWQAAQREAFEEAGVTGEIERQPLTTFLHFKRGENREYRVAAFLLRVTGMQLPTEIQRQPTWFSPHGAENAIVQFRHPKYAGEYLRVIRLAVENITAGSSGKG
jgi:8-oxo-dGTP pyrophosphatase MutT (NUDIX family)